MEKIIYIFSFFRTLIDNRKTRERIPFVTVKGRWNSPDTAFAKSSFFYFAFSIFTHSIGGVCYNSCYTI